MLNSFGLIKRFSACLLMIMPVLINQFKYLLAYLFYYRPNCIQDQDLTTQLNAKVEHEYNCTAHIPFIWCEKVLCFPVVLYIPNKV